MTPVFYCNCFNEHEPKYTQRNAVQKNLMCGASHLGSSYRNDLANRGFYFDDIGKNISELNEWLGDLTGLYWIWKNTKDEFVGTNQYRRFWEDEQLATIPFNDKTIYISAYHYFPHSVFSQYVECHTDLGIKIIKNMADAKIIDLPFLDQLKTSVHLSTCNMFFAHRDLFDKICKVLFDIALEMYDGMKYVLPVAFEDNPITKVRQKRTVAYLMERILSLIYQNSPYYFGTAIHVEQVNYSTI